jgi:uncharacterized protein YbgA (DUF1722 family)
MSHTRGIANGSLPGIENALLCLQSPEMLQVDFLKNCLSGEDKQALLGMIEDYWNELVPLIVPLTLPKHHLSRYPVPEWVHRQVYLNPYPKELMLRNDV